MQIDWPGGIVPFHWEDAEAQEYTNTLALYNWEDWFRW